MSLIKTEECSWIFKSKTILEKTNNIRYSTISIKSTKSTKLPTNSNNFLINKIENRNTSESINDLDSNQRAGGPGGS